MSEQSSRGALRPVESGPGVLVHTAADRRLAVEHWLLAASNDQRKTRFEWGEQGIALLPMGTLLSAVRLPMSLVAALGGAGMTAEELDALLAEVLDGGPVIADPRNRHYYALVPASMAKSWQSAADDWRGLGVDLLGRNHHMGVPCVDLDHRDKLSTRSYWAVPMESAAELCVPLAVARLIAAASNRLHERERTP